MVGTMKLRDAVAAEGRRYAQVAKLRETAGTTLSIVERADEMLQMVDRIKRDVLPFSSIGEQLQAIVRFERDGIVDRRLVRAPSGVNEGDPTSGGFLVQTNFSQQLSKLAYEGSLVAGLCDRRETAAPLADVRIPGIDETSRADGSRWGGALAYWAGEAATVPSTLPRFKHLAFSAKKLVTVVCGTSELFADAPMLDAHIRRVFALEAAFKLDDAVINGSGAGLPLGILNSSATITVPKTVGQASGTITAANISAMWKRIPAPSRPSAVWLVNEDVEEQLDNLGTTNAGFFLPAGWNGCAFPLLKGRPVIACEQCAPVGTTGDIILADLSHYIIVDGGITPMISAHVQFTSDQVLWRFVMRVDGRSAFTSPITPYKGSTTRSPFVALAQR